MTTTDPAGTIRWPEWRLTLSSYAGVAVGARHWYAEVQRPVYVPVKDEPGVYWSGRDTITPERVLDAAAARDLSTRDFRWRAGDTTGRFDTREDALAAAVAAFAEHAADGEWMVQHDYDTDDDTVLAGTRGTTPARPITTRSGHGSPIDQHEWRR